MYKIGRCTSGGYDLEAFAYKPQQYYYDLTQPGKGDLLQTGVWALAQSGDIEQFKKEFHIHKIIHLSLGPCGVHQFTIEDDVFTFRLGQSMEEFYRMDEVKDVPER